MTAPQPRRDDEDEGERGRTGMAVAGLRGGYAGAERVAAVDAGKVELCTRGGGRGAGGEKPAEGNGLFARPGSAPASPLSGRRSPSLPLPACGPCRRQSEPLRSSTNRAPLFFLLPLRRSLAVAADIWLRPPCADRPRRVDFRSCGTSAASAALAARATRRERLLGSSKPSTLQPIPLCAGHSACRG